MNMLLARKVAKERASAFDASEEVARRIAGAELDEWVSVDDVTDIHLWSDMYGALHATVYPVVAGQTQTDRWVQLF